MSGLAAMERDRRRRIDSATPWVVRIRTTLALIAALGLLAATPARAAKGDRWFGLQLGGSVPTGDFEKLAQTGPEGGLSLTSMGSNHVGVGVDVAYHWWKGSEAADALASALLGPGSHFEYSAIQASGHATLEFAPSGKATPYAQGGFGVYWVKTTLRTPVSASNASREPHFGYQAGAGVKINAGRRNALCIGAMYHIIEPGGADARFLTVGLSLLNRVGGD